MKISELNCSNVGILINFSFFYPLPLVSFMSCQIPLTVVPRTSYCRNCTIHSFNSHSLHRISYRNPWKDQRQYLTILIWLLLLHNLLGIPLHPMILSFTRHQGRHTAESNQVSLDSLINEPLSQSKGFTSLDDGEASCVVNLNCFSHFHFSYSNSHLPYYRIFYFIISSLLVPHTVLILLYMFTAQMVQVSKIN